MDLWKKQVYEIVLDPARTLKDNVSCIQDELKRAAVLESIRCITITGQGSVFLTGQLNPEQKQDLETVFDQNKIPVILAVNGQCEGAGKYLLETADLAVAADTAVIEGFKDIKEAVKASAVNEVTSPGQLEELLKQYVKRLLAVPAQLIAYGHKIYFAMEKMPDKLTRSKYGASVIDEIMEIQAELNRKLREETGKADPYSGVQPDEEITYKHEYDKEHSVLFEIRDNVEYIQLNAPRYRNMMDWRTSMELAGAYAVANTIPTLKAIVVTGTGKRFHLGGIRHEQDDAYEQERFADQLKIRNQIMREIKVPLTCAVNGECSGGGMSLVLKADKVIAAESAVFGYPEVQHNGFACNSMVNTMGVIPKKAALKYFYFGDLFTAKEAKQIGIVDLVVPDELLDEAVQRETEKLSEKN